MYDIVDETLGNADPNDYVRFILKTDDKAGRHTVVKLCLNNIWGN